MSLIIIKGSSVRLKQSVLKAQSEDCDDDKQNLLVCVCGDVTMLGLVLLLAADCCCWRLIVVAL